MPLVTVQNWILNQINNMVIPGPANVGRLEAYITPPDPRDSPPPAAYIWPSSGREQRQTIPRNSGPGTPSGWKELRPDIEIYLTWFNTAEDPYVDDAFPSVVDAVMQMLRTSPDPATVIDPNSGLTCYLVGVGEHMTWQAVSVTTTSDQRWIRYDAVIMVPFLELIQA